MQITNAPDMKNTHLIALFLLSSILVIMGALFKIMHFEIGVVSGNVMLSIGMLAEVSVIVLFIIKTITNKNDNFLNK